MNLLGKYKNNIEDEFQERLDALTGSNDNLFKNDTWDFLDKNGRSIKIEFSDLLNLFKKYPSWTEGWDEDWIYITKIVWIHIVSSVKPHRYTARLQGIKLLWSAMGSNDLSKITRENSSVLLEFFLMHGWIGGRESKGIKIKSYTRFIENIKVREWRRAFLYLDLDFIDSNVTEDFLKKKLKQIVPALTKEEMTYKDWFEGGNLNYLSLDKGRYYVEHSFTVFEHNYPLAIALASTFKAAPTLAASLSCSLSSMNHVLSLTLQGNSIEELKIRCPKSSLISLGEKHEKIISHFQSAFKQAQFEDAVMGVVFIKEALIVCGLNKTQENIDRFQVILWEWLQNRDQEVIQHLLENCQERVQWKILEKKIIALKNSINLQPIPVLTTQYYINIGLYRFNRGRSPSYLRQFIDQVSKAGLTNMVALTGWRKSEFGFPISAITRKKNEDKLDQYAFPWRYQVDWYVSKTSGKVKQLREITFNMFMLAEKLNLLNGGGNDSPCLYTLTKHNSKPDESGEKVTKAVATLWGHFVENYIGFEQLDDLEVWKRLNKSEKSGGEFIASDQNELQRLLAKRTRNQWENISVDMNLKETWLQVRKEWPLTEFKISRSLRARKDWLIKYRNRSLQSDWMQLLDKHLSEDVKYWMNSLSDDELRNSAISSKVVNSIMEGVIFPNPHSFRHMWAEAIYRRFDGDVGWMIRSQFKHISRAMWLAYIRDKDNRYSNEQVKQQVISSLVRNYLLHKGEGYSGQMHIWLRRLIKKTTIMSPEEQISYVERLTTVEIENIKANPWGYCLLKRRTKRKAKCSEGGEPMRHNASPDLCLGCTHNLMQKGNVDWSLFHAASHVEAIRHPDVPVIFKESSYKLVKNIKKHVSTLDSNHEALQEIQEVLDNYKAGRI